MPRRARSEAPGEDAAKHLESNSISEVFHVPTTAQAARRYPGGAALKKYRERAGLPVTEVGVATHLTSQAIELWERGVTRPRSTTLLLLADLYGVDHAKLARIVAEPKR